MLSGACGSHASDRLQLLFAEYQRFLFEMLRDIRDPRALTHLPDTDPVADGQ